jgi:hypothetical protein
MKALRLYAAILTLIAIATLPAGVSAVEGKRSQADEDGYGQGRHVGYRADLPERQYPEYGNYPMKTVEQPYLTPDTLRVTLSAGESVEEHKLLHLPANAAPAQGDILFSFDLTGSMADAIGEVKVNASAVMESVRALIPDTYFGVMSHQDYPEFYDYCGYAEAYGDPADGDVPYRLNQPLSGDIAAVHSAITGLTLGDGADAPECYSRVLYEATADDAIGWREGSTKMVILWGDAVPHDCDYRACIGGSGTTGGDPGRDAIMGNSDDLEILDVITEMAMQDIMLLAMYNGPSETSLNLWDCFARRTGGKSFEVNPDGTIPGGTDLPSYIASIISEQFEQIDRMTLEACDPDFDQWLISVSPAAYFDIVLDEPVDLEFDIVLRVPEGTPPGEYCFDICAIGDGAIYATQNVCIKVLPGGCIDLGIGSEPDAQQYEFVEIPVSVGELDGWGITEFEIEVCWCDIGDFMTLAACGSGEVMQAAGWSDYSCSPSGDFCMTFSSSGATPLSGSGPLFYLEFEMLQGAPCECCSLWFGRTDMSDGDELMPICPTGGEICMASCSIEGYVYNWYCEENGDVVRTDPIEDASVLVTWCESPVGARLTDAAGHYLFECLSPLYECPYCVTAEHDPIPGNIRAYDASLILQNVVGAVDLEDCPFETGEGTVYPQKVAADVSCNETVNAYDASLILQYVVEKITGFPCPPWVFIPEEECSWDCDRQVDFIGVLIGDVSGPLPSPAPDPADDVPVMLDVPHHYDGYVEVPIRIKDGHDICAAEFEVLFDSDALIVDDVYAAGPTEDFMPAFNVPEAGRLLVGIAGDECVGGSGNIAVIVFKKKYLTMPVVQNMVSLNSAMFNEGTPPADIVDKTYPAEIHRFALGPVSPNPFSAGTAIRFELPTASKVKVSIYDVNGQLVRTLFESTAPAGVGVIDWDGTDSGGERVARGVYFVRMEAGEFKASEKVVLLK